MHTFRLILFTLSGFLFTISSFAQVSKKDVFSDLLSQDLVFHQNAGQWDQQYRFLARTFGSSAYFSRHKVVNIHPVVKDQVYSYHSWELQFVNASENSTIIPEAPSHHVVNYISEANSSTVPSFRRIKYAGIYPGIDFHYYGQGQNLKYDVIVHPHADLSQVELKVSGCNKLEISAKGSLIIHHPWGTTEEQTPVSFQSVNGKQHTVDVSYRIVNDSTFGYQINANYNPVADLIIDPVTLIWGTYVGGSDPLSEGYLYDLTTDSEGNVYATGYYPASFPVTDYAFDKTYNGTTVKGGDIFVVKLDRDGEYLHYATYIGGKNDDRGFGIAVNSQGEAFVTGETYSTDFPVTDKAFQQKLSFSKEAFALRLNSMGSSLIYSTFLGGLDEDKGHDIIVDAHNQAYVVGETKSSGNFPVKSGSLQTSYKGGPHDGFVVKLTPEGDDLVFSTFLGGQGNDVVKAIVLDANLDPVITGYTNSSDFPVTAGAYDQTFNGDLDAFVCKLDASGTNLYYSTYIGGSLAEEASDIDLNGYGDIFITGYTFSNNYPNTYPDQVLQGLKDVFVTRLSWDASTLMYSRLVGGSKHDEGTSILVNAEDQAFVAGTSESDEFPEVENGVPIFDNASDKLFQVFLFMLDENGEQIKKSIRVGGSYDDYKIPTLSFPNKNAICDVAIGFTSHSPDLYTTPGSFQTKKLNGGPENDQPAIFKLYFGPEPVKVREKDYLEGCLGDSVILEADLKPADSIRFPYPWTYLWTDGDTVRVKDYTIPEGSDSIKVYVTDGCTRDTTTFYLTEIKPPHSPGLGTEILCDGMPGELDATIEGRYMKYLWNNGATTSRIPVDTPGFYKVIITNQCGVAKDSATFAAGESPTANLGNDKTLCFPGSYTLTPDYTDGGLPVSYKWSTEDTSETIEITEAGTYSFTVENVCGSAKSSILIEPLNVPEVDLGPDTSICDNSSISLVSGHELDKIIRWSTGESSAEITVSDTGTYWVQVTNICGTSSDTIYVGRSVDAPYVNLGKDTTICGDFALELDAENPGASYYWSTKENSRSITVNKGGIYIVTATNGCGEHTDTISVTSDPDLVLSMPESADKCAEELLLKAQEPGKETSFEWSTGETTPEITATTSGIYWVKAENSCGSAIDSVLVQLFQLPPKPSAGNDTTICRNSAITLSAGDAGTEFLWSTGESTQSIQVSQVGTYWVKVKNSCGENSDSVTISHIPALRSNLQESRRICVNEEITLDPGPNDASYLWSTGERTQQITVSEEGLYQVAISNECETIEDAIFVYVDNGLPVVSLGNDTTICDPAFLLVLENAGSEGEYHWTPGAENSNTISVDEGGTYSLTVTNGCGSQSASRTIIALPAAYLPPSERVCSSGTVTLDAKNNFPETSYLWSTGETTKTITVDESGIYWVRVENTCGTATDTIPVSLDTTPPAVDLLDVRMCSGETAVLDAENVGAAYKWNTGADTEEITVSTGGKYWVEVSNGCGKSSDTTTVLVDASIPDAGADKAYNLCIPFTQTLRASTSNDFYQWSPGGQTTTTIRVKDSGIYQLVISNTCGSDTVEYAVNGFNFPSADLGPDIALCADSVLLDPQYRDADFFWTPTQETSDTIIVYQTGGYKVQAHNICGIVSDSVFVILDKEVPQIELGQDTSLCTPEGILFALQETPGRTFLWQPKGETTSSLLVTTSGTYSVQVENQCGTSYDTISIAENVVDVYAGEDTAVCFETEVTLTTDTNPLYSYAWYIGDSLYSASETYTFTATKDSTYQLVASDGICYNIDSIFVGVYPDIKPEIAADPIEGYIPLTVSFYNKNVQDEYLYIWDFGNGDTSHLPAPEYTFTDEQIYNIVLTSTTPEGCLTYDTTTILTFDLFIPNLITPNGDQKNDAFDLTDLHPYLRVDIYNRWGDLVFSKDGYIDDFDAENLSDGVYFYHVVDQKYGKEFRGWVLVRRKYNEGDN